MESKPENAPPAPGQIPARTLPYLHFVGLAGSPWTERARWMLDHHGLQYRYTAYRPLLDQPWLRWFTRQPTGRLHLPVLRDRKQVVVGSFQVVQHAERAGTRARLLIDITAIVAWNRLADQLNAAGRVLAGPRLLADAAALDETMPPGVPPGLRPALRAVARHRLGRRLGLAGREAVAADLARLAIRPALERLRGALTGGPYLVRDRFSYADIAMATALAALEPPARDLAPEAGLGPAWRACHTDRPLADEFADLLAWRDEIYRRHRRPDAVERERRTAGVA